jgi:hypothetical protein
MSNPNNNSNTANRERESDGLNRDRDNINNNIITRSWILLNRPISPSPSQSPNRGASLSAPQSKFNATHAGFLYGLALNGHLSLPTPAPSTHSNSLSPFLSFYPTKISPFYLSHSLSIRSLSLYEPKS